MKKIVLVFFLLIILSCNTNVETSTVDSYHSFENDQLDMEMHMDYLDTLLDN